MEALPFLARKSTSLEPFYVLAGDEAFLKRQVLRRLKQIALGDDPDDSAVSSYSGEQAEFAAVWDELQSLPLFSPRRVIVIDDADKFVSNYRSYLEKKVEKQAFSETGVLILDVKTWPANTRLAKMVDANRTITCKSPAPFKLPQWSCEWALAHHGKQMTVAAGQLLVELVGADMGLLDQEILKLAIYVGDHVKITPEDVDKLVGNSRMESVWKIFDLIGQGQTAASLKFLQRLLEQGEEPMRLVGAISSQLRKLAQATRLSLEGGSLQTALASAGIAPFGLKSAEAQLRHLGRKRATKLYDWLLELNMDLRGNSPLSETTLLERFLLRLASRP